jgi:hypothetical protein
VSVRANWHLRGLDLSDAGDPVHDIMALAKPIDLTADKARLNDELARLLHREQNVSVNTGVECEIKWLDGGNKLGCSTCPHSKAAAPDGGGPLGAICRIGLAQERTLAQLAAHTEVEELERMAAQAFLADECAELAELAAAVA